MKDYFTKKVITMLFQKAWNFYRNVQIEKNTFTLSDCEKIADEIKNVTGYVISARSYYNLYNDGGAKNDSSLEAICAYLLLKNNMIQVNDIEFKIIDTKVKTNDVSQKPPSGEYSSLYYKSFLKDHTPNESISLNQNLDSETVKISNFRKIYFSLIVGVLSLVTGFWWYQKKSFSKAEIEEFNALIRNANDAELGIYRQLPKIDTSKLDDYFIKNGMAKGLITSTVKRMYKNNLSLVIAPSSYRILKVECMSKTDTSVMVETHEYWYLRWVNRFTNADTLLYDVENIQLYQLLKEGGKWKIDLNKYAGKTKRLGK